MIFLIPDALLAFQKMKQKDYKLGCLQSLYSILNPNKGWASDPGQVNQKVHLPDHGFWSGKDTDPTLSNQKPSGTYTGMIGLEELNE